MKRIVNVRFTRTTKKGALPIMGTANQTEQELMGYISDHKIRNTHSHHLPEQATLDFNLDKLINNTYLQWMQITPGSTAESRSAYLEKVRYKSFLPGFRSPFRSFTESQIRSQPGTGTRFPTKSAKRIRIRPFTWMC